MNTLTTTSEASNSICPKSREQVNAEYELRKKNFRASGRLRNHNTSWNRSGCGSTKSLGFMLGIAQECNPADYYEFYYHYLYRLGNHSRLREVGERYYRFCKGELTLHEAMTHALIHCLDETFDGLSREKRIIKMMQDYVNGETMNVYSVEHMTQEDDIRWCLDVKIIEGNVKYEHREICAIQIKPPSFFGAFKENKTKPHISSRHAIYKEMMGVPVLFATERMNNAGEYELVLMQEAWRANNSDPVEYEEVPLSTIFTMLGYDEY